MKTILVHDRCLLLHGDSTDLGMVLDENSIDAIVCDPPASISFMGSAWDSSRGGFDGWTTWLAGVLAPSFRALKPGGHAAFWALPRTSDWTMRAVRLAGFEIRDVHHDILAADTLLQRFTASLDDEQRTALASLVESQESPILYQMFGSGFPKSLTSESAEIPEWAGTALKPAVEHWIIARKPLDGTIAEVYARHDTGVLNIDACRIGGPLGRWPAHLSLEHAPGCVETGTANGTVEVRETTAASTRLQGTRDFQMRSQSTAGKTVLERAVNECVSGCPVRTLDEQSRVYSKGGASRFLYVPKAPRSEKDAGLAHLTAKTGGEATGRVDGSAGTASPRAGAGRTGGAKNSHPTTKSVALMTWLVKLLCPPGGTVLDPFAGSGTTGVAALAAGYKFVGCEQGGADDEYIPILLGRIEHALATLGS